MKIYIATKFENVKEFKELQAMLEEAGHEITHDWTKEEQGVKSGTTGDNLMPKDYLAKCAKADLDGVMKADALIFIPVKEPMAGAWVEVGIALASCIPVILIDNGLKNCIFFHLGCIWRATDLKHSVELLYEIT